MFVFSTKQATETGNLEVNSSQFKKLSAARNASAQAAADFIARTKWRGDAEDTPELNAVNAVDDIRRLYKAYDQTVLKQFEPNTEFTLLNDLMPLSRSVRLEESVYEYARTGGRGWAHTSMSGQIGAALDAKSYTFDGTMVPIHDSGFKFNWRDPVFNKGSALSSLADAQAGSVDDVRRQYVDYIWEGFRDAAGNYIKFDDKTWKGLRHDERVAQVTLTVNFATSTDPKAMRAAAIALRDVLKLQNMQYGQQTWYVSSEIMSNWEQYFDVNSLRTVLEEISKLSGVAAIKEDAELTGNEIVIVPLQAGVIAPIVGQAFGTVADPRQFYNSDYVWRTWGAAGLMVKQDINGHYSVIHASS
ncbi:major capsid protein [Klebsiella aerogenes]|uniref:major capsid protein n=1 Tax=Klebsiella aerogenes TaxID=548 RepID=UPI001C3C287C|nr:major capsid protein [Klebsiella aerogenes]MBV6260766.1 phage coat protein [Klebsiella aerogenes]MBV6281504.1 phage coat protein [Klebsiella aerogenes]